MLAIVPVACATPALREEAVWVFHGALRFTDAARHVDLAHQSPRLP
jgi:hypothetical protein